MTNLLGQEMKIAINQNPPYFELENKNNTIIPKGLEVEILKVLSSKFNFTYQLINCNETWGTLLNDTWTGIFGQIDKGLADFGISEISLTDERAFYFNFSYPYLISTITFITSSPKLYSRLYALANYFDQYVWFSFLMTMVINILILYIISKILKTIKFIILFWLAIEVSLKQSIEFRRIPRVKSFKTFFLFWVMFWSFFSIFYSNCIYSLMVLPIKMKSIDTIQDLYNEKVHGNIFITIQKDTSSLIQLMESEIEIYKEISMDIEMVKNDQQGIESLIHSNIPRALITSRQYLIYMSSKYEQGAYYLPSFSDETTFFLDLISIAYKHEFKYIRDFDKQLLRIKEAGLIDFWTLILVSKSEALSGPQKETTSFDLGLGNFEYYFHLLFIGIVVSCFILGFEVLVQYSIFRFHKHLNMYSLSKSRARFKKQLFTRRHQIIKM